MANVQFFSGIRTHRSIIFACAALAVVAVTSGHEVAAETFQCDLTKSRVRIEGGHVSNTTDTSFQDIPATDIRFVQGGTKPGCLVVQFSAKVTVGFEKFMYIKAVIEAEGTGIITTLPPGSVLLASDGASQSGAFNFAARGIAPGAYTLRIQWQTWPFQGARGRIYMHDRSVILHHQ